MSEILKKLQKDIHFIEGLNSCMNCGICTAICPAAEFYNYDPRVIVETVQRGNEEEIEAVRRDAAAGNRDGLDGLVERAGPNGLHLRTAILADHAGQSAGDRIRIRFRRNFQDFHDEHDLLVHLMLEYVSAIHAAI